MEKVHRNTLSWDVSKGLPRGSDLELSLETGLSRQWRAWATCMSWWGWWRWREWMRFGFFKREPALQNNRMRSSGHLWGNSQCGLSSIGSLGAVDKKMERWVKARLESYITKMFEFCSNGQWFFNPGRSLDSASICKILIQLVWRRRVGNRYPSIPQSGWEPPVVDKVQVCEWDNKTWLERARW